VAAVKKHYDFSKSVKNPYLSKAKKQLTIRLDENTFGYFKGLAEKNGIPYQKLINLYLRECAESGKTVTMEWS
jgi:predicted DNA binding CopG/RHH family protein